MSLAITFRARLGGDERNFALTAAVLPELERVTGSGILGIYRRITALDYLAADLVEPVRFGLIGSGENAAEAARLVDLHVKDRPFAEVYSLALGILEARMFGRAPAEPAPDAAPESQAAPVPVEPAPAPLSDAPSHLGIGSESL